MKLEVNTKTLSRALKVAGRPITGKTSLPILDYYLIKTDPKTQRLIVTGSNGETTIMTPVGLEKCSDAVEFTIMAKFFEEAISLLTEQTIEIETNESTLTIKWQKGSRQLPITPATDYPVLTGAIDAETSVTISGQELASAIENTLPFCATTSTSPVMEGINLAFNKDNLKIAASDTHFLRCATADGKPSKELRLTIHSSVGNILKGIIKKETPVVKIEANEKTIVFNTGDSMVIARTITSKYPDYTKLMPNPTMDFFTLTVDVDELRNALKRILSCHFIVKMEISPLSLRLTSEHTEYGSKAAEDCDCTFNGESLTIKAAAEKMITILDRVNSKKATIKLTAPAKPMYFTAEEDTNDREIALLMPVM